MINLMLLLSAVLSIEIQEIRIFENYEQAKKISQSTGLDMLLYFSSKSCPRQKELNSIFLETVQSKSSLTNDLILVWLDTEDITPLKKPLQIEVNQNKIILRTQGNLNSYLQQEEFKSNIQPCLIRTKANLEVRKKHLGKFTEKTLKDFFSI